MTTTDLCWMCQNPYRYKCTAPALSRWTTSYCIRQSATRSTARRSSRRREAMPWSVLQVSWRERRRPHGNGPPGWAMI